MIAHTKHGFAVGECALPSAVLLGATYFIAGWLGTQWALPPGYATAVFPASGIALAGILGWGYRVWPGILLGSLALNTVQTAQNTPDFAFLPFLPVGLAIGLGAVLEAVLGAWFLQRFCRFPHPLNRLRDVLFFVLFSGALAGTVNATMGPLVLCTAGITPWSELADHWLTWWLGDTMGILVITPLYFIFKHFRPLACRWTPPSDGVLLFLLIGMAGQLVFGSPIGSVFYPLLFTLPPLLVWAAFRFEQPGAVFSVLLVSLLAVANTVQGTGPFADRPLNESLFLMQGFIGVVSVMALALSAEISERKETRETLRQARDDLERLVTERTGELRQANQRLEAESRSRKRAKTLLLEQNRVLEKIARGHPLSESLNTLIQFIESGALDLKCSVLLLDKTGTRLTPAAAPSLPATYPPAIQSIPVGAGNGSCGTAAFKNDTVIVEDIETDPLFKPFKKHALDHEFRACWSSPIRGKSGNVLGTFAIYYPEPRKPTCEELDLVHSAAYLAGIAVERAQTEEALKAEHTKFYEMLDNLPLLFHVMGKDHSIPFANKKFRDHFGDPEGRTCYELLHHRSQPCLSCTPLKGFNKGGTDTFVWTSDQERTYQSVVTPFQDLDGTRLIMEMSMDISEQKQVEEKLKRYAEELERSNTELQDFASIASHDLQEPLRKITTFGDRLASLSLGGNSQAQEYLDRMRKAAHRMQHFIDDLLMLSRITSKAKPFEPTDLKPIVEDILSDLDMLIQKTGTQVTVQQLPQVTADPFQMRQLFQNLITNAIKYSRKEGAPQIQIDSRQLESGAWEIRVQDNGIGFDEKYLDKIFKPFHRLHGKTAYEGTGMGLAICKKIVDRHGGRLTAKSRPGEGATFLITLHAVKS